MRVSHRYRFVYFSIPKTASESVRRLLDPLSDEEIRTYRTRTARHPLYSHMRPVEFADLAQGGGLELAGYFRFATVRNPFARLVSLYRMAKRDGQVGLPGPFRDWVETLDPSGRRDAHVSLKWYAHGVMSMSAFLSDADGVLLVDRVYRIEDELETLRADLAHRVGEAAVGARVPVINAAPRPSPWRSYYDDPQTVATVLTRYGEDFDRFGYDPSI